MRWKGRRLLSLDVPSGLELSTGEFHVVLGHERVIYLGNGEWQPLDDRANR
jgi:hypothetical protein